MNAFLLGLIYLIIELNMFYSIDYLGDNKQLIIKKSSNYSSRYFPRTNTKLEQNIFHDQLLNNPAKYLFFNSNKTIRNVEHDYPSRLSNKTNPAVDLLQTDHFSLDILFNSSFVSNIPSDIDYIGYRMNNNLTSNDQDKNKQIDHANQYWALCLLLFPVFTIAGNILIVLSVFKEKSLKTITNYYVVSLAIADLIVAVAVMPFAVYYEVILTFELNICIMQSNSST